jgi:glyoxylase-like metal-dependent hydrolase (beta-lactamase superfamily II)
VNRFIIEVLTRNSSKHCGGTMSSRSYIGITALLMLLTPNAQAPNASESEPAPDTDLATDFRQQDFSQAQITVSKVAGNVYMLEGWGGNVGVSIGDDGIVIVDDQFEPLADKIRAALRSISDKPLRFIINTHLHFDHTDGNLPLHEATIVAHDNVRKRMASGTVGGVGGTVLFKQGPSPKQALPVITFQQDVTIHVNGEDIHALHAPTGHTDGDSIVYFRKSNVVHMGDDFVTYGFPFVDLNSGGSVKGVIVALEKTLASLPADVKIIPGHGPVSTADDVRAFIKMLKETSAVVARGVEDGKTLLQLQQEKVLEPWQQYNGPFITADLWIETLYNEMTSKTSSAAK